MNIRKCTRGGERKIFTSATESVGNILMGHVILLKSFDELQILFVFDERRVLMNFKFFLFLMNYPFS